MPKEFTISNKKVEARISEIGAQLVSFQIGSEEVIWPADSSWWGKSAPILFPIIGFLKNGRFSYNGKSYKMRKHGFLRDCKLNCIKHTKSQVVFELFTSVLKIDYPFRFKITISFLIDQSSLCVEYFVKNLSNFPSLFNIGSHPAFNLLPNTTHADYEVIFDTEVEGPFYLNEDGLVDFKSASPKSLNKLSLTDESFSKDALIFKSPKMKEVRLRHSKSGEELVMSGLNEAFFALWAPTSAPFICLEPWQGVPDTCQHLGSLEDKEGVITLCQGATYKSGYRLAKNTLN